MMKVLRNILDPRKYPMEGLELEVHQEMDKERKFHQHRSAYGWNIPLDLPVNTEVSRRFARKHDLPRPSPTGQINDGQRAFDTTAGAGTIPTIVETTIIELLRARMVTRALGARIMTDMQGLFAIPRQTSASTFYMVTQGGAITASQQGTDQVPFSPHTGGVYTTYTRQLLEQTNLDAEMFVREDQSAVIARGVETQMLNGQGSLGYPMGILQNPLVGVISSGTNGGAPTWTNLVTMESAIASFNADVGSMAYCMNAVTRGTLKTTTKIAASTFPIYLWNTEAPDFPVNGYPVGVTNLMPSTFVKGSGTALNACIMGNWEDAFYAFWSGMDVIVDPFTAASQGAVNICTLQDFDVNIRHYQSFVCIDDIISNQTVPAT
jgi:HK97 family phage major capsid protein